jgi:DHA1 family multidrug resistance protein-like MFS transporter
VPWLLTGTLVSVMGASAIFPIVPLYVRSRGGGALGVAFFVGGALVANALTQIPAGRLVDRVGRKPMLVGSMAAYAALSALLAMDRGPLWLLGLLRAGQGVFSGTFFPATRATLADLTPPERRAELFGMLQSAVMVGLLVGPAVGGAVAEVHQNLIFVSSAAGAAITAVLILLRVPETRGLALAEAAKRNEAVQLARPGWWRRRGIVAPMVGLAAMGVIMSMYDVVWPQYLSSRGNGTLVIGLSVTLFALPILLLSGVGGRLADRANRRVLLGADFSVAALTAVAYPFLRPLGLILGVGVIEAVAWTTTEPTLYAVLTDAAPVDARGRAMAMGGVGEFAGNGFGAVALGSLYGLGEAVPFWAGAGVLACAGLLCAAMVPARAAHVASERAEVVEPAHL